MSTAFSQKMQGVANRLLTKYGSTVTLVRTGAKIWDDALGEYVFGPDEQIPLNSVPVPVNAGLVNGTTIQAGDMIVKADSKAEPAMSDKIDFNGARWSVVAIECKQVNDDVIAWFIQVRK